MDHGAKQQQIRTGLIIGLIVLGGPAGWAAIAYDFFKRGNYQSASKPDPKKTVIALLQSLALLFLLGTALAGVAANLVLPGISIVQGWAPALVQIIVGVAVTGRYLHKHNIYFTSPQFWKDQDFEKAMQAFTKGDLKELLTNKSAPPTSSPTQNTSAASVTSHSSPSAASTAPSSPYAHNQQQAAIVVDQSGDAWRVKLIVAALFLGIIALGYYYLAKDPEATIERASQLIKKYVEVESL